LDDTDIFTVYSNLKKRSDLMEQNESIKEKLAGNRLALKHLSDNYYLEHYARSKKFFKAKDEEIFVIIPNDSFQAE
jgi:cell division protein FtsB